MLVLHHIGKETLSKALKNLICAEGRSARLRSQREIKRPSSGYCCDSSRRRKRSFNEFTADQGIVKYGASVLRYKQAATRTLQQYADNLIAKAAKSRTCTTKVQKPISLSWSRCIHLTESSQILSDLPQVNLFNKAFYAELPHTIQRGSLNVLQTSCK